MPAQIVTGEFCSSYFGKYEVRSMTDPYKTYIVMLNGGEQPPSCTCPAFQHALRRAAWDDTPHCKHIDYVWTHACMWNCQWHEGNDPVELKPVAIWSHNVIAESHCTNCEEPLVAVLIAV